MKKCPFEFPEWHHVPGLRQLFLTDPNNVNNHNYKFNRWSLYPMMLAPSVYEVIYTLKKQLPVPIRQNDYKLKILLSVVYQGKIEL